MPDPDKSCPLNQREVIEHYFMEHRAKVIDIAAFLDRFDRAEATGADEDFRMKAFREALATLSDGQPQRARRVLEFLSDHSTEPIISAAGMKGALGACPPGGTGAGETSGGAG